MMPGVLAGELTLATDAALTSRRLSFPAAATRSGWVPPKSFEWRVRAIQRSNSCAFTRIASSVAAGIVCDPWQAALLRERPRRALLCCSRQSGKSTITALLALHVASYEPNSLIVLGAPSQRQSAEMLRTIRGLHAKVDSLPELPGDSVLRLEFSNGSRVLALPGDGGGKTSAGSRQCASRSWTKQAE
jgi:hypothetical protein